MISTQTLFGILSFGYLFFAIATASTQRFWVTRRYYAWSSAVLALFIFATGLLSRSASMIILGLFTFFSKSLLIPLAMTILLSSRGAIPKLSSMFRPTMIRFLSLIIVVIASIAVVYLPGSELSRIELFSNVVALAAVGIAVLSLGAAKSTYGQLFGVLMIENAFALLILTLGIEFQLLIELGLLAIALIAWYIMHILSDRIRYVFGDEAIDQLSELSE